MNQTRYMYVKLGKSDRPIEVTGHELQEVHPFHRHTLSLNTFNLLLSLKLFNLMQDKESHLFFYFNILIHKLIYKILLW